jgi:selenocysteine lyase/cysteine desulfurase
MTKTVWKFTRPTPKVVARLWEKWRIIATPIVHAEYEGARITPNVYTTLEEVDTFAGAMEELCATAN